MHRKHKSEKPAIHAVAGSSSAAHADFLSVRGKIFSNLRGLLPTKTNNEKKNEYMSSWLRFDGQNLRRERLRLRAGRGPTLSKARVAMHGLFWLMRNYIFFRYRNPF